MGDVRVDRVQHLPPVEVPSASDERRRQDGGGGRDGRDQQPGGREELAVALDEGGRALSAQLEAGADGEVLVRILDRVTKQTVAVVTPEELRVLTEQTGLPSGVLFQARR